MDKRVKLSDLQRERQILYAAINEGSIDYFDPPPTKEELDLLEKLQKSISEATKKGYTIDIPYDYD